MTTFDAVYQHYLSASLRAAQELREQLNRLPHVLKCDSYNEAEGRPVPGGIAAALVPHAAGVRLLEYDAETIAKAKRELDVLADVAITVLQGDIRSLAQQPEQQFDLLIDCSTIDHVQLHDVPAVIAGYAHVLRDLTGQLLLWAWCSSSNYDQHKLHGDTPWDPRKQYYLDEKQLEQQLQLYFDLQEPQSFTDLDKGNPQRVLRHYQGRKRPWAYLQGPALDERFAVAAEWLHEQLGERAGTATVWDLNCGSARFRKHFATAAYVGNDIHNGLAGATDLTFMQCTDQTAVALLPQYSRCDVLAAFGIGAGHIVKNGWESETVCESIRRLVQHAWPCFVVLENPAFPPYSGVLDELEMFLRDVRYQRGLHWVSGGDNVRRREVRGFVQ